MVAICGLIWLAKTFHITSAFLPFWSSIVKTSPTECFGFGPDDPEAKSNFSTTKPPLRCGCFLLGPPRFFMFVRHCALPMSNSPKNDPANFFSCSLLCRLAIIFNAWAAWTWNCSTCFLIKYATTPFVGREIRAVVICLHFPLA